MDGLTVLGRRYEKPLIINGLAHALSQQTGVALAVAHLLVLLGVTLPEEAARFLNPRLEHLPNPSVLKDLDEAARMLAEACASGAKLSVFGDYDVDGMCATAIICRYLTQIGRLPELYIPHRLTEGYGPTPAAMDELKKRGVGVVITVDTGTSAHEALSHARDIGLTVIVTDHHQPGESLPPVAALINPHRADDTSGLTMLCGSGVAFYLLMGLNRELRARGFFKEIPEPRLTSLLDLVALGTIADVVPLVGPNRTFVSKGLQQLNTGQNAGLKALAKAAGLVKALDAGNVAFGLGPRLNAAGRVDNAKHALDLLLCDDEMQAATLAEQLNKLNEQRRATEKQVLAEAVAQAERLVNDIDPALVLAGDWHPGVVGIVASRIKEKFNRVAFVLGVDDSLKKGDVDSRLRGNGAFGPQGATPPEPPPGLRTLKGSGRGVKGLDLGAAVRACSDLLLTGGGHAMAAGVGLMPENLDAFRARLNDSLREQIVSSVYNNMPLNQALSPMLAPRLDLPLTAATIELTRTLSQLAPFGAGNDEPVLMFSGVQIAYAAPVGDGSHLKLRLASGGAVVNAICFGQAQSDLGHLFKTANGRPLTVFGTLKVSSFNGQVDIQVLDALPISEQVT
jgi:single-stranded-DNA-specific exonuclease